MPSGGLNDGLLLEGALFSHRLGNVLYPEEPAGDVTSFDNPMENHFVCGNDEPLQDSFL